jgi:hypothetical protein
MHSGVCDEQDGRESDGIDMYGNINNEYGFDRTDPRYGDPDWREKDYDKDDRDGF